MSEKLLENRYLHFCKRCDHKWIGRLVNPRSCIKCKSTYWNKYRVLKRVRSGITKRYKITCKRCYKTWNAETEHPVLCRYCKSVYWDCDRRKDVYKKVFGESLKN